MVHAMVPPARSPHLVSACPCCQSIRHPVAPEHNGQSQDATMAGCSSTRACRVHRKEPDSVRARNPLIRRCSHSLPAASHQTSKRDTAGWLVAVCSCLSALLASMLLLAPVRRLPALWPFPATRLLPLSLITPQLVGFLLLSFPPASPPLHHEAHPVASLRPTFSVSLGA
ncbi:hypothetical protein GGI42DRAFT_321753, partial [Trichoderma sp. SZMC 28013]